MRIPGFRHKWVDSIEADQRVGPPFTYKNQPIKLVAIQRPKRILRPKKTIYIYRIGNDFYMADDPNDYRFIPFAPEIDRQVWIRRFFIPTPLDREWLQLNNYTLVRDLIKT
jgi:hypothetical protein